MQSRLKNIYHKLTQKSPVISGDLFIKRLSFANAGMMHPGNVHCFEYVAKHSNSDSPILEIGSFCGLSTNAINHFYSLNGKKNKFFTSDKWEFESTEDQETVNQSGITGADYSNFVKESYKRNVRFFSKENLPYTIEAFSDEFFQLWDEKKRVQDVFDRTVDLGGKFSFVFIDGNHTYEYAKRDFENTDKHLEVGGYILFDDSSVFSPFGCALLMKEIEKMDRYEVVIKNPNYLFRKKADK